MTKYVLGFMFSPDLKEVILLDKLRPEWQRGLFNGVGGKVEPGESPWKAMQREFREECSLDKSDWLYFGRVEGAEYVIHLYATTGNLDQVGQLTDERPVPFYVNFLTTRIVPNARWMVYMAQEALRGFRDSRGLDYPFYVVDHIKMLGVGKVI